MFTGFSFTDMPSLSRLFNPDVVRRAQTAYEQGIEQNEAAAQEYTPDPLAQIEDTPSNSMFGDYVEILDPSRGVHNTLEYRKSNPSGRFMGNASFQEFLENNLFHPTYLPQDAENFSPLIKTNRGYMVDKKLIDRLPDMPHFNKIRGMIKQ